MPLLLVYTIVTAFTLDAVWKHLCIVCPKYPLLEWDISKTSSNFNTVQSINFSRGDITDFLTIETKRTPSSRLLNLYQNYYDSQIK